MKIIIPARGGSKRIPKKNLLDLNGKSLLYYSIKTSLNITNDVYVSTEDKEIKKFLESMNVNVIDRPEKLAADESKTEDVVEHFLEEVDMNGDDLFCVVQPTSPLLHFNSTIAFKHSKFLDTLPAIPGVLTAYLNCSTGTGASGHNLDISQYAY